MTRQSSPPATQIDMLVIEDDLVDELALTRALQQRQPPYRVTVARSVAQARTALAAQQFDIILADCQLGDGTSFDLMDALAGQLFIFVTGAGDEDLAVRALAMGAHDYLLKDAERGYLKLLPWRVDTALRNARDENALRQAALELAAREKALAVLVAEKTALLKEVHHRVKNNLQVITSLLRLEAARADPAGSRTQVVLGEMQGRIRSMALLHESLYRSSSFAEVDLGAYLKQLSQQAFRASADRGTVRLEQDLGRVTVSLDQATSAGLLVNELISNALKHAFPQGRSGVVRVTLQPTDGEKWCLQVSDDGIGLPADFAARRTQSLGLQLVDDLAIQMQGSLHAEPFAGASGGSSFYVIFTSQICL
jgi:two-component sensor histidine kinase